MSDPLAAIAAQHWGAFTTADALACGWTKATAGAARRSGRWRRLKLSAYVDSAVWASLDERGKHLCLVHAALLTRGQGWRAGRRSAAIAHQLPILGRVPEQPQLARQRDSPSDRSPSRHDRVTELSPDDCCTVGGLDATSLARTVTDLAREESFASGLVLADAALRRGMDKADLRAVAERCARWPGGPQSLRVAHAADGLAETALESRSRASMILCGLPIPELQVEVWLEDRLLGCVDFLWRAYNLVGEADGRLKYDRADAAAKVYAEKIREEDLEDVGLEVARWDWRVAANPGGELEAKIARGMARGALNRLDPRVRFAPQTLEQSLQRAAWYARRAA